MELSLILHHSDNLNKTLQHTSMTAAERQNLSKLTVDILKSLCKPDNLRLSISVYYKTNAIMSALQFYLENAMHHHI